MLMRTATGVPPATALVGHVKGDAAHSASPARRAGSSWEKSACRNAGKGKVLNALLSFNPITTPNSAISKPILQMRKLSHRTLT